MARRALPIPPAAAGRNHALSTDTLFAVSVVARAAQKKYSAQKTISWKGTPLKWAPAPALAAWSEQRRSKILQVQRATQRPTLRANGQELCRGSGLSCF